MFEWLKPIVDLFAWAVAVGLLVKYRDKGILRQIGQSKYRFRSWLKSVANAK
jgi:hypothetical protein